MQATGPAPKQTPQLANRLGYDACGLSQGHSRRSFDRYDTTVVCRVAAIFAAHTGAPPRARRPTPPCSRRLPESGSHTPRCARARRQGHHRLSGRWTAHPGRWTAHSGIVLRALAPSPAGFKPDSFPVSSSLFQISEACLLSK